MEFPGPPARRERIPTWIAILVLLRNAIQTWEQQDPEAIPVERKILERDEYRCRCPECSRRRTLEAHHIRFRSRGGSDRPENKGILCHAHHRAVHRGRIRVTGKAPGHLTWEIGCAPGLPPLWVLRGERILRQPGPKALGA